MQAALPALAYKQLRAFLGDIQACTSRLNRADDGAASYVEKLQFLAATREREAVLDARGQEVSELYALIQEHGIAVPGLEAAELAAMEADCRAFKDAVAEVESMKDDAVQERR